MSTEESKPTEQETQQQSTSEQATQPETSAQTQQAQQPQQAAEQAVAKPETKPEVKEVKLPRPRVSLSGKLRQLLRLRLLMERREPRWMRMDEWRYLRVAHGEHWRRPRGGDDNKIRLEIKGYPKRVKVGYGKPRLVRNLHPSGFRLVIVHRPEEVDRVDPTREAIVIGRTVGLRKRIEIVKRAIEKGVRVINVTKDVIEELRRSQ
ncbi:50S ribosomal protein L32e [Vulcanisaeta distributa]|uniref:50S ribosomal protein L32e n=1 Tax=Vulcanisaeta distributa TaxID=164451 RepID=UPI000ACD8F8F|nr:50S ribosomal protein L32e [Vulcanisaeta distributa]